MKKVFRGPNAKPPDPANPPMFNGTVLYGNLVFISGIGYHQAGDITVHTTKVLEQMKSQLEACGSSMEKVLKVNVYLNDLKDYDAMNAVFRGKFGPEPACARRLRQPVGFRAIHSSRSTVSPASKTIRFCWVLTKFCRVLPGSFRFCRVLCAEPRRTPNEPGRTW